MTLTLFIGDAGTTGSSGQQPSGSNPGQGGTSGSPGSPGNGGQPGNDGTTDSNGQPIGGQNGQNPSGTTSSPGSGMNFELIVFQICIKPCVENPIGAHFD